MQGDEAAIQKIDDELGRLRAQIEAQERHIEDDANKIVRLLEEDFPAYLKREVKARFLNAPEFAAGVAPDTLVALKRELEEEGRRAAAEIGTSLRAPALWLFDVDVTEERAFDLADVPEVWRETTRIERSLEQLLAKYGFPPDDATGYRCGYKAPTWFVSGALLKTLLEAYHTHLIERSTLRRSAGALEAERRTRLLELKWEAAR